MNRFKCFLAAAILAAFAMAATALAQTPVNISVVSGNGQVICQLCPLQSGSVPFNFDGMYVKVTDSNGNPVANAAVNWTVTLGSGLLSSNQTQTDTVQTNSLGIATESYLPFSQITGSISNPFMQSTITATLANGPSVNFYETQAFANVTSGGNSAQLVQIQVLTPSSSPSCSTCISPGDTLSGNAGTTSTVQFKVQAYVQNSTQPVVPNVSLRLVTNVPHAWQPLTPYALGQEVSDPSGHVQMVASSGTSGATQPTWNDQGGTTFDGGVQWTDQGTVPTISCATGAGADPGAVLTDSTGTAVCTAVIGPTTGFGTFYALVGGVASVGYNVGGAAQGYFQTGNYKLNVLPGAPGSLQIVSGNNLSASPGQQVPGTLLAAVFDSAGNPLSGQSVVWTVSPSTAATLSNTTTSSDVNGHVQTNLTLTNSASGQISVSVALASNPRVSATFSITANVQITGLQILSGNNQTALVNSAFAAPLIVQLTSANGQAAAGIPVNFTISGPATLSASTVNTNSLGQATVNVQAGGSTGAVTVSAISGSFSASFSLSVIPSGPTLSMSSFYNGADFQPGAISPCGIATIIAPGIAAAIQGTVAYDGVGALPYSLGSVQVTFSGAQAPIYNVANTNGQQQVTVQVPCSVTAGNVPVVVTVGGGSGTVTVPVRPASPGLFLTEFNGTSQVPVLERPDGSFVSPTNPAHRGETVIAFVTGMGATTPAVATNALPAPGSSPAIQGTIIVGMNGGGVPLVGSAVSPDLVGVETVSFMVPATSQTGNNTFSIGIIPPGSSTPYYSNIGFVPVQ